MKVSYETLFTDVHSGHSDLFLVLLEECARRQEEWALSYGAEEEKESCRYNGKRGEGAGEKERVRGGETLTESSFIVCCSVV